MSIICKKGNWKLYTPLNSQDMNYHVIDAETEIDYLIDICDVYDHQTEEITGLDWSVLKNLSDMDEILNYSWKQL